MPRVRAPAQRLDILSPMAERDDSPPRKCSRLRRLGVTLLVVLVIGGVGGELVARYALGLGDPPLYRLDPDVEYILVPGRTYHRMGNVYAVNAYSMRSPEFSRTKPAGELRVLVVGDSIVNGGARVDQTQLATEALKESLQRKLARPVVVANASAASWGPPNELAFVKKFGIFDADIVILVLNSDDLTDVPGIEGIGSQWPRATPTLALEEIWDRTIVKWIERATGHSFGPAPNRLPDPEKDEIECLDSARAFFDFVKTNHARPALVQHLKRSELVGTPQPGLAKFRDVARAAGVPAYSAGDSFRASLEAGRDPYLPGDSVHANATGQKLLSDVLEQAVLDLLKGNDSGDKAGSGTGSTK